MVGIDRVTTDQAYSASQLLAHINNKARELLVRRSKLYAPHGSKTETSKVQSPKGTTTNHTKSKRNLRLGGKKFGFEFFTKKTSPLCTCRKHPASLKNRNLRLARNRGFLREQCRSGAVEHALNFRTENTVGTIGNNHFLVFVITQNLIAVPSTRAPLHVHATLRGLFGVFKKSFHAAE